MAPAGPPAARPLAVSLVPLETRLEVVTHLALAAEQRGYAGFAPPEAWAYSTPVALAHLAARTERLLLVSNILSVWGRSAATIAMAAATLDALSGGRFVLGLGASTAQLAEGLHDVPFRAPFRRMREVTTQVRALLRGERIPLAVAKHARALKLNLPPAPGVRLFLAGLAEETIRLAGELADGWLPFMYARDRIADAVPLLEAGARRAGSARPRPAIWPGMPAVVAETEAEARARAAWFVVFYLTSMGPLYPKTLTRLGFGQEVKAVQAANTTRGAAVVPPEAEVLLDQLIVWGTPESARQRLARWYETGAQMAIVLLPANLTREQLDFTLDALAPRR